MGRELPPRRWLASAKIELTLPFHAGHFHLRKVIADALVKADPEDVLKPSLELIESESLYELGSKPEPSKLLGLLVAGEEDVSRIVVTPEHALRLSAIAKEHGKVLAYTVRPGQAPDGGPIIEVPIALEVTPQEVFGAEDAAFIFRLVGGEGRDELCGFLVRSVDLAWLIRSRR